MFTAVLALRGSCSLLAAVSMVAACGGGGGPVREPETPRPGTEPRLVVLLVIDQWPEWAFEIKRPALTGGFDRLLRDGDWHVGQYPYASTITSVGHTLIGTGEPPSAAGILSNEWWRRDLDRPLGAVMDENRAPTHKWLRVPGLGDAVAAAGNGAKAVSVSLKDRAAILPLGHAGTAIWYDAKHAAWTSLAPVPWLAAWNAAQPISAHFHDTWTALPETARLAGIPDDAPGEISERGLGTTFPHALDATKSPADAIFATPMGNDLVLDTATTAIDREQLGTDATSDLLVVSLSAHDYVGHGWGQESWESWDTVLRLDRRLDKFLADLDAKVGVGRWAMVVTSDHGASPKPETLHGGRITIDQIKDAASRAAVAELGPGEWIAEAGYPTLYLTKAALAQPPRGLTIALTKIVYALRSFPGLERVEKSAEFWGHCETRTGDALALCLTLDPERSGEIIYLPAPGWVIEDADDPVATSHGSLHPYDRLVPVIELPPGRTSHAAARGPDAASLPMTHVSTIVARWLGVTPPTLLPRAAGAPR